MKLRFALATVLALVPAALAAESWKEVDRLPGDIVVELDEESVSKVLDGENEVIQATFRREMPAGVMESDVAMDCARETAKLRGLRLVDGTVVYNQPVALTNGFHPVSFGSSDAIYFKALCGRDIAPPEGFASGEDPVLEEASPGEDGHPLDDNPVLEEAPVEDRAGQ